METTSVILAAIQAADTIIIHRHQRPDPDALGSQFGLRTLIKAAFPTKKVYAVGDVPTDLAWLGLPDQVADATFANALVIVVDTANTERIDDGRYLQGRELIKIDHHPNDDAFGDPQWVLPEASSTSELIMDLVNASNGQLPLTAKAARLLYAGIVGDTGRFLYPATSAHTLQIASQLLATGIDAAEVSRHETELSRGVGRLMGDVLTDLEIDANGAAYFVATQERLTALNVTTSEAHAVVSTPGRLEDVIAWLLVVENADGTFRVHLRSKGPVINGLAKGHHGGGHDLASGANAADQNELMVMKTELANLVQNWRANQ
ncbi:DHH family phosphoesterase [Furfurilactobacillus sp. WILCCON 0119]